MAKCFMCGAAIGRGILCEKCDKPRKNRPESKGPSLAERAAAVLERTAAPKSEPFPPPQAAPPVEPLPQAEIPEEPAPPAVTAQPQQQPSSSIPSSAPQRSAAATAEQLDPFPKAPVVQFPFESASPAITSVVTLLVASGAPSILLGQDRSVKFVSDEARKLFDAAQSDLTNLKFIEQKTGLRIGDLSVPTSAGIRLRERSILYSLVPLSGGASGAVLVFRSADGLSGAHASFATYVRETAFGPLRALRDSLASAGQSRDNDPFLLDAASTVEQVLSSLELAPEVEEPMNGRTIPTVTDVVHQVAERFRPFADLKGIQLQIDAQELEERFRDSEQLADALGIMMDNSLHYVPPGGQVVVGVRWMEHKGKPLVLFFVMDNGPVVPEQLRQPIFEPDFVWNPTGPDRTGRSLFKTREFAVSHAGSVWVESKSGKACTFFLRVRPDGVS
jgi:hypothetical protein